RRRRTPPRRCPAKSPTRSTSATSRPSRTPFPSSSSARASRPGTSLAVSPRLRSARRRQTGAAAVFAAIAAGAGLTALALAIDVGRLYAAQRDLQRIANLAALDAARVTGGCFGEPENPSATAFNEAVASIARNGGRETVR